MSPVERWDSIYGKYLTTMKFEVVIYKECRYSRESLAIVCDVFEGFYLIFKRVNDILKIHEHI